MSNQILEMDEQMKARFGRVAVLYGGNSAERSISLKSGQAVIDALCNAGLNPVPVDTADDGLATLPGMGVDRVFIALHGADGEDGTWQGALELLGIPYTGSGVLASALAMDKARCKQLWAGIGLPTAAFCLLDETTDWHQAIEQLSGKAMVKPCREGSSIGMRIASSADQLRKAWLEASRYDNQVLAEQWLNGGEYTVAILGDRVLPPIKLETDREFYDFEAKYEVDDTRYICPCGLDKLQENELKKIALQAFTSLGCEGWGRVDLMVDAKGSFQLLEVNTVPGMTSHSLVPMAAQAAGISFEQLVLAILASTLPSEDGSSGGDSE